MSRPSLVCTFLSSFLALLLSRFSFLATNLMSSRWVYHHRRENRRLTGARSPEQQSLRLPAPEHNKTNNNTTFYHDRFVLLYYHFLVGTADFCLEIPISAVIWEWERNDAIPPSGLQFLSDSDVHYLYACDRSKQVFPFFCLILWRDGHGVQRIIYLALVMLDGMWIVLRALVVTSMAFRLHQLYVSSDETYLSHQHIQTTKVQTFIILPLLVIVTQIPPTAPLYIACIITTHACINPPHHNHHPPPISPHITPPHQRVILPPQ
jgi:hypothetical protein